MAKIKFYSVKLINNEWLIGKLSDVDITNQSYVKIKGYTAEDSQAPLSNKSLNNFIIPWSSIIYAVENLKEA